MENCYKKEVRTFFFFFFFFFFFLLFTFENAGNLFWVYKNGNFYREKAFHAGKKIRKNDFMSVTPLDSVKYRNRKKHCFLAAAIFLSVEL